MNRLLIVLSLLLSVPLFAQDTTKTTEKVNQKDSQGRKQGKWKKPYDDVKMYRYVGQFKNDVPYGKFVYFYKSGNVQAVINFSNGGKTTRSKMYHNSGYMMAQGKYINKKKDSVWVYYDDRGLISYTETYEGGELNGQKVYYYAPRDDGKYPVARYEYYKNGLLHGEFKEYHENTKVKISGAYKDGNYHGKIVEYYADSKIKKVKWYKYAVKHGNWAFYNEKGVLIGTQMYWEGKALEGADAEEKKKKWQAAMKG